MHWVSTLTRIVRLLPFFVLLFVLPSASLGEEVCWYAYDTPFEDVVEPLIPATEQEYAVRFSPGALLANPRVSACFYNSDSFSESGTVQIGIYGADISSPGELLAQQSAFGSFPPGEFGCASATFIGATPLDFYAGVRYNGFLIDDSKLAKDTNGSLHSIYSRSYSTGFWNAEFGATGISMAVCVTVANDEIFQDGFESGDTSAWS